MTRNRTRLAVTLNYDHGSGYLAPFFEHLMEGRPLASRCPECGAAWFPPSPTCPTDGADTVWDEIKTQGRIVALTRTRSRLPFEDTTGDHTFVLVAMEGAANAVFGRLQDDDGEVGDDVLVELAAPAGSVAHPAQAIQFRVLESTE